MSRKWTDDQVAEAMRQDPLAEAERITGGSYKGDQSTQLLGLGLAFRKSEAEQRLLEDAGDTHGMQTLDQYCSVVSQIGFKKLATVEFQGEHYADELQIWWESKRGLLLVFDTYCGRKLVNSGHCYYNWLPKEGRSRFDLTSSGGFTKSGVWCGYHDCRKGLRTNINRLAANGEFISPWVERQHLWLCHYGDLLRDTNRWRENDEIAKRVKAERIAMLPSDVRSAICQAD